MQCPTCAGTHFSFEGPSEDDSAMATCASCGRSMTRAELREENSENIEAHVKEIGRQAAQDLSDELRKTLKDAFKGSKSITIK
ncbi:ECs_2282 family putative zinc-binding protein [Paraburkholderia sejongensis]|uniref:ECs_2282 family putative zinc-binding protein n=1 Tax=Paraburkholderia sejongensis TaxID=2886946 RepID=UPI003CE5A199